MLNVNFSIGSADDARLGAELCDFLAERMTPGAAPRTRGKRGASTPAVEQPAPLHPNGLPTDTLDATDPAALYAALGGTSPVADTLAEHPAAAPVADALAEPVASAAAPSRDDRLAAVRESIKSKGAAWFAEYLKANIAAGKKLSEFTDDELTGIETAARS